MRKRWPSKCTFISTTQIPILSFQINFYFNYSDTRLKARYIGLYNHMLYWSRKRLDLSYSCSFETEKNQAFEVASLLLDFVKDI